MCVGVLKYSGNVPLGGNTRLGASTINRRDKWGTEFSCTYRGLNSSVKRKSAWSPVAAHWRTHSADGVQNHVIARTPGPRLRLLCHGLKVCREESPCSALSMPVQRRASRCPSVPACVDARRGPGIPTRSVAANLICVDYVRVGIGSGGDGRGGKNNGCQYAEYAFAASARDDSLKCSHRQ